jgi:hypothetical protein
MTVNIDGLSVFLGLAAGIIVQVTVYRLQRWIDRRESVKTLAKEIDLNLMKLKELSRVLKTFKEAVTAERLDTFTTYISVSSMLTTATYAVFSTGLVYEKLDLEHISELQSFVSLFSQQVQSNVDFQIRSLRETFDKDRGYDFAQMWEQNVENHEKALSRVKSAL